MSPRPLPTERCPYCIHTYGAHILARCPRIVHIDLDNDGRVYGVTFR